MTEFNQAHIDAYFDSQALPSDLEEFLTMLKSINEAAQTSIHGKYSGRELPTDPAELAKIVVKEDLAGGNTFAQTQGDIALLTMLESGYVTFLGKTMQLVWPEGKPEHFDEIAAIIINGEEADFRAPEDPMDSPDLTK